MLHHIHWRRIGYYLQVFQVAEPLLQPRANPPGWTTQLSDKMTGPLSSVGNPSKQQGHPEQASQQARSLTLSKGKSRIPVLSVMVTVPLLWIDLAFRLTMAIDRVQRFFRTPARGLLFLLCCIHPTDVPLGTGGLTLMEMVHLGLLLVQLLRLCISVLVDWRWEGRR